MPASFKKQSQSLHLALLDQQRQLHSKNRPVMIVIAGDDRIGRQHAINRLMTWFDPRFVRVNAYTPQEQPSSDRPWLWRFWRDLPAAGQLSITLRDWTATLITDGLNQDLDDATLARRIEQINQFEQALIDDGTLLIKFWLTLSESAHETRLTELRHTPYYDPKDELAFRRYQQARAIYEPILAQTQTPERPWHSIQGDDPQQRDLTIGQTILEQLNRWQTHRPLETGTDTADTAESSAIKVRLRQPDPVIDYAQQLEDAQSELQTLMNRAFQAKQSVICLFEGVDAAGKGGAIRRLVHHLDAGQYQIVPIAAPDEAEKAHHYLWRFWRQIPADGHLTIFDRSWYGRVLVERVEGYASPSEWQRAYQEINDFEAQLTDHGCVLLKFWLHIDQAEQLARFEARERTPHKQHKITDEDYRNRKQWSAYEAAINHMLTHTDTEHGPWIVLDALDKKAARISVLKAVIAKLKTQL